MHDDLSVRYAHESKAVADVKSAQASTMKN